MELTRKRLKEWQRMKMLDWMKERLNVRKDVHFENIVRDREGWKKIGQRLKDN